MDDLKVVIKEDGTREISYKGSEIRRSLHVLAFATYVMYNFDNDPMNLMR